MKITKSKKGKVTDKDLSKLSQKIIDLKKDLEDYKKTSQKNLSKRINTLQTQFQTQLSKFSQKFDTIDKRIKNLEDKFSITRNKIQDRIKTQKEILLDMIQRMDNRFLKDKNQIYGRLDELKEKQDTLKVSFSVNEERIVDQIKEIVKYEMASAVQGKESELLMKLWLDELREIISEFDKLGANKPHEFLIKLKEIKKIVQGYRTQLQKMQE
ncbi:MAG: hypothetical protein ACOC35_09350 [Promethearchaeia archaeon]